MGKFLDAVFPLVPLYRANKVVRQKIHPKNENGKDIEPSGILSFIENADNLSSEIIKEQYNETFKVKEKLEDKAKTNIIGVTISITLIMGASGVLSTLNKKYPSPIFSWILFFLIREARLKKRLTQEDLAARVQIEGVIMERDSISRVEIGTRFIPDYEIPVFARVLGVSVLWLLGIE